MSDNPISEPGPAPEQLGVWKRFLLVAKVIEVRLRFIVILLAVFLFIRYWDTAKNYWDKWTRPASVVARQLARDQEFFCPMHPNVVRTDYEPNGDVPQCPICGMPLSIRKKGQQEALPPGVTGRVQFSPERVQLAGIKTARVDFLPLAKDTTTVGYVTFDESRLSRVVSRVAGYVEKLYVDTTFSTVREGQPLAEIYSPDLYSGAQELLLALRAPGSRDLAASARRKLALLGLSEPEIEEIARTGSTSPHLVIRSPRSGLVMQKMIVAGSNVEPGMTLLEVADLSKVWVGAEVFEKDIGALEPGQQVEATVEALPGRTFRGRLALIYPRLDTATRTNRARFELDNSAHELRPGMFATVRITTPLESMEPFRSLAGGRAKVIQVSGSGQSKVLAVPEMAVVDTGAKQVVYIERKPGVFEGVEVRLGPRIGGYYPVVQGLEAGQRVAAAGSFLIDAETRLNPAAASSYFGASGGPQSGGSGATPASPVKEKTTELSPDQLKRIDELPVADRRLAIAQKVCPITGELLGSMGVPFKISLLGKPVLLCCKGCVGRAQREPEETLKKIGHSQDSHR